MQKDQDVGMVSIDLGSSNVIPSFAVIGGGFGGINAAIQIKKKFPGSAIRIFEKAKDFGGTWYWNRYPGCECDIPSHFYSLSYEMRADWPRHYSGQSEIKDYLCGVAKKYGLYDIVSFETTVTNLKWDESTNTWQVTTVSPNTKSTPTTTPYTFVFVANGPLHVPKIPDFPNLSSFKGPVFHSSQWKNDVDFKDKTVAIIGTGASSVQIVPRIINDMDVKGLVVFQRSAAWVPPKVQYEYSKVAKWIFEHVPFACRLWRNFLIIGTELRYLAFLKHSLVAMLAQFLVLLTMKQHIKDTTLRKKLTPKYPFGALRVTPSNEFYPSLANPKSTVVTDTIDRFTESGITVRDENGNESHIPCDIVIMATGFDVQHGFGDLNIVGKSSLNLVDQLGETPKAFNCTMYPNYPNIFHLLGPNSGFGHFSVVHVTECQMYWSLNVIKKVYMSEKRGRVEVNVGAFERFNEMIQRGLKWTVWDLYKKSWYANEKRENFALWPFTASYMWWWFSKKVKGSDFI
ncbi:hypothetical protein HDU76_009784 [Blyttiomyces sp. JEL0837]|nr:hypothetical protein HDU76_009784 [Blyttiomyces sp. JEL0837]